MASIRQFDRPPRTAAARIRRRIEGSRDQIWRPSDFAGLPGQAVGTALSRLAKEGVITRLRRGVYYRSRPTVVGPSRPAASDVLARTSHEPLFPAGLTAAATLGFTTQNPAHLEYVTTASRAPMGPANAKITARRPQSWRALTTREGALLEFLRDRGVTSDLSDADTTRRLLQLLRDGKTIDHLLGVAPDEPARVRAMLGALGQELGVSDRRLRGLRHRLSPLSTYDFGRLKGLTYAAQWQAR